MWVQVSLRIAGRDRLAKAGEMQLVESISKPTVDLGTLANDLCSGQSPILYLSILYAQKTILLLMLYIACTTRCLLNSQKQADEHAH